MKTISFVNMKGGVGKTTLVVNVADVLSRRRDKKVLLVDADPQFNATQCLFSPQRYMEHIRDGGDTVYDIYSENPAPIISAVAGVASVEGKELEDISPTEYSENLHIVPGNLEICRIEVVPGHGTEMRLKAFLKSKSDQYDFAIIDTPPTPSVFMSSALLASDYYVSLPL